MNEFNGRDALLLRPSSLDISRRETICPPWQGNGSFEEAYPRSLPQGVPKNAETPVVPLRKGDKKSQTFGLVWGLCCASETVSSTRTRSTASLPDHVYATHRIVSPLAKGIFKGAAHAALRRHEDENGRFSSREG